ncbi:MAG: HupE/UreJ family protein [Saprospiraceae bacterium]|nr:HupE/UreJ family protein [Saprospiraceae bacterium]MCC6842372.1 HupE/UreJ family protein [Saprospiraceae bacterium]
MQVFWDYIGLGFKHVLPLGYDHILFIISMFLLNSKLKSSIIQCSVFTIAHSLTLALATMDYVPFDSKTVEIIIALSIFVIAFENFFQSEIKPWRMVIVFIFGLIHGLGFASVLKFIELPEENFIQALFGFNCGVELAQVCVIAICYFLIAKFFSHKFWYRTSLVIPLSTIIAGLGLFFAIQRFLSN